MKMRSTRTAGAVPSAEAIITRAVLGSVLAVICASLLGMLIWREQWAAIALGSGAVAGSMLLTWGAHKLSSGTLLTSVAVIMAGSYVVKLAAVLAIFAAVRSHPNFDLYWIAGAFIAAELLALAVHTTLILTSRGPGLDSPAEMPSSSRS